MKPVHISLPPELRQYADQQARNNIESLAAYIRRLILEDKKRNESA